MHFESKARYFLQRILSVYVILKSDHKYFHTNSCNFVMTLISQDDHLAARARAAYERSQNSQTKTLRYYPLIESLAPLWSLVAPLSSSGLSLTCTKLTTLLTRSKVRNAEGRLFQLIYRQFQPLWGAINCRAFSLGRFYAFCLFQTNRHHKWHLNDNLFYQ